MQSRRACPESEAARLAEKDVLQYVSAKLSTPRIIPRLTIKDKRRASGDLAPGSSLSVSYARTGGTST